MLGACAQVRRARMHTLWLRWSERRVSPPSRVAKVTQWADKSARARPSLARDLLVGNPPGHRSTPMSTGGAMRMIFRLISGCLWHLPLASAKIKCQQQVPLVWAWWWGPPGPPLLFRCCYCGGLLGRK